MLSASPDLPHHSGDALFLKIALEWNTDEDLPQRASEPLPLRLAFAIRSTAEVAKSEPTQPDVGETMSGPRHQEKSWL
jgi:hypothetical protein